MDFSFTELNYNSIETLPGYEARAAFTVNSSSVFREDVDIVPTVVDDTLSYIPWGGDNQMPFVLLDEVCYGSGLQYCVAEASAAVKSGVKDFTLDHDLATYFLGISLEFTRSSLASASRSSTSASPSQCLFSTRTVRASSVCGESKPAIVASPRLTATVVSPKSFTQANAYSIMLAYVRIALRSPQLLTY